MFFSIVIPIHNSEKYLKQCFESILNQTCKDFEVILVNDGSSDGSARICDQYCNLDARFKVIHREKGGGAASARNAGTRIATGEYIIYIDSDDYIENSSFFSDVQEQALKGFDIICYKFRKYYEDTNEMTSCSFSIPEIENGESVGSYVSKLVKSDAFYCAPWTKSFRRKILEEGNIQFQEGLLSEDQEWYYHVLIGAKTIVGIDKSYIVYRQHKNSTSISWSMKNLTDTISIIASWKEKIENSTFDNEYKSALLNSVAKLYCNLLIGYTKYTDSNKKNEYEKLKKLSSLMKYNINPRVNMFDKIYKIGGFESLMFALKIICRLK